MTNNEKAEDTHKSSAALGRETGRPPGRPVMRSDSLRPVDEARITDMATGDWGQDLSMRLVAAHAARRVGWSRNDTLRSWLDPRNTAMSAFQEMFQRKRQTAMSDFERCWAKTESVGRRSDPQHSSFVVIQVRDWAESQPQLWTGKSGQTKRDVLDGVLDEMLSARTTYRTLSHRRLSDRLVVVQRKAVGRALDRLVTMGILRRIPGTDGAADAYQLLEPSPETHPMGSSHPGGELLGTFPDELPVRTPRPRGDAVFGLSVSAVRLWERLSEEPVDVELLRLAVGVSKSSVHESLGHLARARLAHNTQDGWVVGSTPLDEVAAARGTVGKTAARSAKYAEETQQFRVYLAQLATAEEKVESQRRSRADRTAWAAEHGDLFVERLVASRVHGVRLLDLRALTDVARAAIETGVVLAPMNRSFPAGYGTGQRAADPPQRRLAAMLHQAMRDASQD